MTNGDISTAQHQPHLMSIDLSRLENPARIYVAGLFLCAHLVLTYVGYALKESPSALTIIWPAEGLLVVALWWLPPRQWWIVLVLQSIAEQSVAAFIGDAWPLKWRLVFLGANFLNAAVVAVFLRSTIPRPSHPHVAQVVRSYGAMVVGTAVGAIFGAWAAVNALDDTGYLRQWQIWFAGNLLGIMATAPLVLAWSVHLRIPSLSAGKPEAFALTVISASLLGATISIFSVPAESVSTILQLPFVLILLVVAAPFLIPPRWAITVTFISVLIAAAFASRGYGPFADDTDLLSRIGTLQWFLGTMLALPFLIATALLERRRADWHLRASEERYRSFVELSSEIVWRVEVEPPMPMSLSGVEQVEWLKAHASIAECNLLFERLSGSDLESIDDAPVRCDVPWSTRLLESLPRLTEQGFSTDKLRFKLRVGDFSRYYLASVQGVVEGGRLARIWGVARDVSELTELNERLETERAKLAEYVRLLTTAEERARRNIAVDLHDGLCQQAIAQGMGLADLKSELGDSALARQIDNLQKLNAQIVREAREIIAELSPPGIYDVGLSAALEWLVVQLGQRDGLEVELDAKIDEQRLDPDGRILLYRVTLELLRNVVKHSGTRSATVRVKTYDRSVSLVVTDHGRGFDARAVLQDFDGSNFGLWSVAQRIHDAGGDFELTAQPGDGCSVRIELPVTDRIAADPGRV